MPPPPTPAAACEFSPCKTGPNSDPRKVISHIFGRNKSVTKRFPPHVWVHYCRQHYQRARYRANDWAVTQCQLVLVSLGRMEEWSSSDGDGDGDGERISGFRVVLRRRVHRSLHLSGDGDGDARAGKRNPTSTSASAQSTRKSTLRQTRSSTAAASTTGPVAAQQQQESSTSSTPPPTKKPSKKPSKKGRKANKNRKKPTITPNPVPGWLRAETSISAVRSFAEIRDIVGRLKDGFEGARHSEGSGSGSGSAEVEVDVEEGNGEGAGKDANGDVLGGFPDIEILPVFRG